jgi:DNA-binding CsgD family transcriptional regulator/tetratricopeptide (TPR) repeat protein
VELDRPVVCPALVGRGPALAALERLVERTLTGQGGTLLLAGEAGVGKSRLAGELGARARARGFAVLQAHCFEDDRAVAYAPLRDLLGAPPADRDVDDAARGLGPLVAEVGWLLPWLPAPPVVSEQTGAAPAEGGAQRRRRLFDALCGYLTRLAASGPLIAVVEDLHWADDSSLDFLRHLSRRVGAHPLLLVLTYRDEEVGRDLRHFLADLDRDRTTSELTLARLTRSDLEAMCRSIFPERGPLPAALLGPLHDLTDGNPFFVEETLRTLLAAGDLVDAGGGWAHARPEAWRIPRSVQDMVGRRAEQLTPPARRVLALAAVLGQRFDVALVQALAGLDEEALLAALAELVVAQLVVELSADRCAFRHALTREAVYRQLLARERRRLHRAVARELERAGPSGSDALLVQLAYHAWAGEDWARALDYAGRSGARAAARDAPRAAVEQLTRALDAAAHLGGFAPPELRSARARALETIGDLDGARADYEAALAAARDSGDRRAEWQALIDLGAFWAARDYGRAGDHLRRALDLARSGDDPAVLARSLNHVGNWLANTGRPADGALAHREALALFERSGDRAGMAATLDLLAMATTFAGDPVGAVGHLDRAIDLLRALGDRRGLASCLAARGPFAASPAVAETTHAALWPPADCLRDADEAASLARTLDWPVGLSFVGVGAAPTCAELGEYGQALAWATQTLRIADEVEHDQWRVAARVALGGVYAHLMAPERALAHLEAALPLARRLGSAWWVGFGTVGLVLARLLADDLPGAEAALAAVAPPSHARSDVPPGLTERRLAWARGEVLLRRGRPDAALRVADDLLASVPGEGPPQAIPALLRLRGEALAALGRTDEAAASLEAALGGAAERGQRPLQWRIHRLLGRLDGRRKRTRTAGRHFAAARELVAALAETVPDAAERDGFRARAMATLPPERPRSPLRAAREATGGLTRREREVAALVAQGRSNREIAAALVLSEGTVSTHVSNILGKLDCTSRAQIAAWAVGHGLVGRA